MAAANAACSSPHHAMGSAASLYRSQARPFVSPPPPRALLWRWPRRVALTTLCSAPSLPRLGSVGLPRRKGNASLLSFRADTAAPGDPSQAISALLPLVVVATAVAALGNPATFSWYATWALQEGSLGTTNT
jgi:bile acid:Na+ symporter, BASS family